MNAQNAPTHGVSEADALKRLAGERAAGFVQSGMRVGLGTGSTARHAVDVIAERLRAGTLADIVGVPTSRATEERAREHRIPLSTLNEIRRLDVTIDGADEIDPSLDLIKGHGGALLWEKMVASASDRMVIVADDSKLVQRLGARMSLPVEVIPFGWQTHEAFLAGLGCFAELRTRDGQPVVTDGGHYLLDCSFEGGMEDPARVATLLKARTGIVETGLFIGMATAAVIASADGVRVLEREGRE